MQALNMSNAEVSPTITSCSSKSSQDARQQGESSQGGRGGQDETMGRERVPAGEGVGEK